MPILLEEYMKLSRDERTAHLDLSSPCDERGGDSREFRGLLAHYLNTTIAGGYMINLCHACHNSRCSNPKHLYWGTAKDNQQDRASRLRELGIYGPKKVRGKPNVYTPEKVDRYKQIIAKYDQSEWGWLGKCANEIGISHTQLRRFLNKFS